MNILDSIKRGLARLKGKTADVVGQMREPTPQKKVNLTFPAGVQGNQMLMGRVEARLMYFGRVVQAANEQRKQDTHNENQRLRACELKAHERKLAIRQRAALA